MSTTDVSAKDVMALRQKTGLGMMDCKKALIAAGGDADAAEAALREKLKGKMDTRADRAAGEGCISIAIDGSNAAIIELRAETDFTARNDSFRELATQIATNALSGADGDVTLDDAMTKALDEVRITTGENISLARGTKMSGGSFGSYLHHDSKLGVLLQFEGELSEDLATGICQHVAANVPTPMAVDEHGLPGDLVALKAGEAKAEAENSGKPPEIAAKIAEGKIRKFFEEVTLVGQKYVRDDSKQIGSLLPKGTTLKNFVRLQVGGE
ncbi:MAG: translation elongation factor Ts [Planctomycetia bacterium]|jgi:elongation factor Ts|nr:translation elongation factor Ts [Planctomycetia bacterium]